MKIWSNNYTLRFITFMMVAGISLTVSAKEVDNKPHILVDIKGSSPLAKAISKAQAKQSTSQTSQNNRKKKRTPMQARLMYLAFGSYATDSIEAAIANGNLDKVIQYIKKGMPVDQIAGRVGHSLLMLASLAGEDAIVEYLIKKGANVNFVSRLQLTSLMRAANANNLSTVKLLIRHKANVNLLSGLGGSAITTAMRSGNVEVLDYLLSNGGKVNTKYGTDTFSTPITKAAAYYSLASVKILIKHGADVNAVDYENHTPIWHAINRLSIISNCCSKFARKIMEDELTIIKTLVKSGAKLTGKKYIALLDKKFEKALTKPELVKDYRPHYARIKEIITPK